MNYNCSFCSFGQWHIASGEHLGIKIGESNFGSSDAQMHP